MTDHVERAKRMLLNNRYMILATIFQDGQPWSTPVFYAYDEQYNFYWYSRKDTRHSLAIKANNKISATIFGVGNADEGFGIYLEGTAFEVSENELVHAMKTYAKKGATNDEERKQLTTKEDFLGASPIRMYKLVPNRIYVSNEAIKWKGKWIDSRSLVNLAKLINQK